MPDERDFGALEARVQAMAESFEDFRTETRGALLRIERATGLEGPLAARLNVHSQRLAALERWRSWLAGVQALALVVWTAFMVFFGGRK